MLIINPNFTQESSLEELIPASVTSLYLAPLFTPQPQVTGHWMWSPEMSTFYPGKLGVHYLRKKESEVAQPCPTLCEPMDYSPPGSSIHGIFQARVLEWGAISFSRGSPTHFTNMVKLRTQRQENVCVLSHSHVWLFTTPWTVAHQAPLSMEVSRPEYWSGLPYPPSQLRDRTRVSCISSIGRQVLYICATWEAQDGRLFYIIHLVPM